MPNLKYAPKLAAGDAHCLLIGGMLSSGYWGWGANGSRQVGAGADLRAAPARFAVARKFTGIAAGWEHSLACDDAVYAWGSNESGQLALGESHVGVPTKVRWSTTGSPALLAKQVAAGAYHSLAVTPEGGIVAWGRNDSGQLGISSTDLPSSSKLRTVLLPPRAKAIQVAGGRAHSLALLKGGRVVAWGGNNRWQLGVDNIAARHELAAVEGIDNAVAVAAGGDWSAVLRTDGTVWAWGDNGSSQLGEPADGPGMRRRALPQPVAGVKKAWAIAAGTGHGIALCGANTSISGYRVGEIWTWGRGAEGQLGDGSFENHTPVPRQITTISHAWAIAAGTTHCTALGRLNGGAVGVLAWGFNTQAQLGSPGPNLSIPQLVPEASTQFAVLG
jgi:alpha-tubulin suppressor-like RCC1 family protein